MAILNLTIFGVNISTSSNEPDIILSTEEKTDGQSPSQIVTKEVKLTNKDNVDTIYNLSLVNLHLHKKMYQPTEIYAEISVVKKDGQAAWVPITRDIIDKKFKDKKVSLVDVEGSTSPTTILGHKKVGEDFYVHAVHVKYKSDNMRIILSIFSLDKQMTLLNTCQTFVCKKLKTDILETEISKFTAPYDANTKLAYDAENMKNLSYSSGNNNTEHIFPFLVQYNESFYDMLARTTNRWGEFMYYEDGKLNVGCPQPTAIPIPTTMEERDNQSGDLKLPLFNSLSYYDVDDQEIGDDNYDCSASYDDNISSSPIRIDPEKITANFLTPWRDKWDKAVMKKFSSFFKHDKNIPTFLGNELFNDLYDLAKQGFNVLAENNDREKEFFKKEDRDKTPEQYAEYNFGDDKNEDNAMGFNPFSEISSTYDKKKYFSILTNEINAGKNAICINFDTSYPCLKLGQIISVYGKEYIVTQIDCTTNVPLNPKNNLWTVSSEKAVYSFQVYALAKQGSQFYPTVIPAGHVRLADPQIATVTDASDPNGNGRVRVMFSWQTIVKDDDKNITDKTKEASSPWLQFTANAGGKKGIMGKHYEYDKVFVGFVDGNVERPYVIGAISKGAGADIHCTTDGSHQLKIFDDEAGIMAFMTGMISPTWGTFSDFIPGMGDLNPFSKAKNNLALAGGFELSDNYGIYKIAGSTDGREVSIASPWGEVNINAFTGINISAPNGDVTIKGKNVKIEAGNNLDLVSGTNVGYKLWKDKNDENNFSAATLGVSMAALVAKKLAEKFLQVIDLSIVRSVVEIVMRPMEGALTVKSNRFLKLESGDKSCEYPKLAYDENKKKALIDAEAKEEILAAVGYGATNLSLGDGTVTLLKSADAIAKDLCTRFKERYNNCVAKKELFNTKFEDLKKYSNDPTKVSCKKYDELKNDLWKETELDQELAEAKVGFKDDNVKIGDASNLSGYKRYIIQNCYNRLKSEITGTEEEVYKAILEKRKNARQEVFDAAKELRKAICELHKLEMTQDDVNKHFSWYWTTMPKDFKKKAFNAVSKAKCLDSPVYKVEEDLKNLGSSLQNIKYDKYMRRLITLNLLEELGFKDDMRKQVNGQTIARPITSYPNNNSTTGYIMHDTTWTNYVESLSGVPPISKESKTLGGAVKGAVKGVIDDMYETANLKKSYKEWYAWGDGKKGTILIGSDDDTYELKGNTFTKVEEVLEPSIKSLDASTLDGREKKKVEDFVKKIKDTLKTF